MAARTAKPMYSRDFDREVLESLGRPRVVDLDLDEWRKVERGEIECGLPCLVLTLLYNFCNLETAVWMSDPEDEDGDAIVLDLMGSDPGPRNVAFCPMRIGRNEDELTLSIHFQEPVGSQSDRNADLSVVWKIESTGCWSLVSAEMGLPPLDGSEIIALASRCIVREMIEVAKDAEVEYKVQFVEGRHQLAH